MIQSVSKSVITNNSTTTNKSNTQTFTQAIETTPDPPCRAEAREALLPIHAVAGAAAVDLVAPLLGCVDGAEALGRGFGGGGD